MKQKLPKHITAHKDLMGNEACQVILKNEHSGLYCTANTEIEWSLLYSVEMLDAGYGFSYGKLRVGKQIVF